VKYYYDLKLQFLCEYTVKCNLFLWSKLNLSSLLQSSVSRDPSQITLIWGSDDQQTFMIIINVESIFCEKINFIFQYYLMNRKFKRSAFIWNIIFCNIINVFIVSFDWFNASFVNKMNFCLKIFLTPNFWTTVCILLQLMNNKYITSNVPLVNALANHEQYIYYSIYYVHI